jgi:hypothetical protein
MIDGEEITPAEQETAIPSDPQPQADGAAGVGGIIATEPVATEEFHQEPEAAPAPFVDVPNLDIAPQEELETHADDPGDSQPVRFADTSAGIDIVIDGVQKFRHVFMPNSTPLHDTLDAALKHSEDGIDLTALAAGGGYTVKVNGTVVDAKSSSLDLGIADGSVVEIELK